MPNDGMQAKGQCVCGRCSLVTLLEVIDKEEQ
jgi:hypothetical protein